MKPVRIDTMSCFLPETWEEVDANRLPRLIQLVYMTPEGPTMYHELIQVALNIKPRVWQKLMKKHFNQRLTDECREANAAMLQQLIMALRWLWQQPMDKQPFAGLTVDGRQLLLPDEGFTTMTYGELTDAYIHFMVFIRQLVPGDEHLDLLVATLCRPERVSGWGKPYRDDPAWNGDRREDYNEFKARDRLALVRKTGYPQRMAVLLYFAANFKTLMDRYAVFAQEAGADQTATAEEYPGQSMMKNQHLLAEKHIFGNISQTKAANVHDVLLFLEEHRKDLLAQIERHKNHDTN